MPFKQNKKNLFFFQHALSIVYCILVTIIIFVNDGSPKFNSFLFSFTYKPNSLQKLLIHIIPISCMKMTEKKLLLDHFYFGITQKNNSSTLLLSLLYPLMRLVNNNPFKKKFAKNLLNKMRNPLSIFHPYIYIYLCT